MRQEAMAKLSDYYVNKTFTALSSIWSAANTPSNYTNVGGHITQVALDNAIETINQTTPGAKAILGVRSALTPIAKFGAWNSNAVLNATVASQSVLDEYLKTGWLGSYLGVPLVALPQQWDNPEDHNALLPVDKILVIGYKVGEFITYDAPRTKEWTDWEPTPPYWHMDILSGFGFMIDNAEGIFVLGNLS
jgi:hypothetical protein